MNLNVTRDLQIAKLCFCDISLRGRFEVAASTAFLEIKEGAGFRGRYMNLKVTRDLQIANYVFVTSASEAV